MEAGPQKRPLPDAAGSAPDAAAEAAPEAVAERQHAEENPDGAGQSAPEQSFFRALRPERRLRLWQIVPVVAFGGLGSLMFAFPLAFEFGDGGAAVSMLGLLLTASSAGVGSLLARRAGITWPGLPPRGSGRRPDWRAVAGYAALTVLVAALAVWRVARLR